MKTKLFSIIALIFGLIGYGHAQVVMNTISFPKPTPNPVDGFTINYTLTGGKNSPTAQINFYMSTTRDGSSGVIPLFTEQITLRGNRPSYLPPLGIQNAFITRFNLPNGVAENLERSCLTGTWYIIGQVDATRIVSSNTTFIEKRPDLRVTSGFVDPPATTPGSTINFNFNLSSNVVVCQSTVLGVYIADANQQPLAFVGGVNIPAFLGNLQSNPIGITLSPAFPTGTFFLLLVADDGNQVLETNENNNTRALRFTVSGTARNTILASEPSTTAAFASLGELNFEGANDQLHQIMKPALEANTKSTIVDFTITNGKLTLNFEQQEPGNRVVHVYGPNGTLVEKVEGHTGSELVINIGSKQGLYVVKVTDQSGTVSKKLHID